MRHSGIARLPCRMSHLGLVVVAASLMFISTVRATDMKELTEKLPRAYIGEFLWDGDSTVQNIVITFDQMHALNEQNAEALGCGAYEVAAR